MEEDDRIPTALWIDAHLRRLTQDGVSYYIANKGAHVSGTVMLKLFAPGQGAKLLQQQRNLDGEMGWMVLFKGETVEEARADDYIRRAVDRDPDVWVIEIEDRNFMNPFEGKVF
ncbi:MAG: DUF1491 family protein [Proteobacteria bacterium]|nr:DUF1491 family protein [Pseudomonadota bacterium]